MIEISHFIVLTIGALVVLVGLAVAVFLTLSVVERLCRELWKRWSPGVSRARVHKQRLAEAERLLTRLVNFGDMHPEHRDQVQAFLDRPRS